MLEELARFEARSTELRGIKRWKRFEVMGERSDLYDHHLRVARMTQDVATTIKEVYEHYNPHKARYLSLVHDDAEIITGDVALSEKLMMDDEQRRVLDQQEDEAIAQLASRWPTCLNGFSYENLLKEAKDKTTLEAQVVSYLDKIDGFCEALREVVEYNHIHFVPPLVRYASVISGYPQQYPELDPIVGSDHPFLWDLQELDTNSLEGTSNNKQEIKNNLPLYARWLELQEE